MFALAFGWAVGCLCLAHLSLAASSANLTANAGPSLEAGSAADYDQPDGLKLLPDHPAGQATLHNLCMQVINSFPLSATTQFAGKSLLAESLSDRAQDSVTTSSSLCRGCGGSHCKLGSVHQVELHSCKVSLEDF